MSSPGTTRSLRFVLSGSICLDMYVRRVYHIEIRYRVIFKDTAQNVFFCSYLQVRYECLSDEIKIGDYYLRLLLEEDENEESNAIKRS